MKLWSHTKIKTSSNIFQS